MVTQNCFTFPFYIPRICRLLSNWPEYLFNYVLRKRRPAEYRLRNGFRLMDGTGTLPGTLAEVFVRRRYGIFASVHTFGQRHAQHQCWRSLARFSGRIADSHSVLLHGNCTGGAYSDWRKVR